MSSNAMLQQPTQPRCQHVPACPAMNHTVFSNKTSLCITSILRRSLGLMQQQSWPVHDVTARADHLHSSLTCSSCLPARPELYPFDTVICHACAFQRLKLTPAALSFLLCECPRQAAPCCPWQLPVYVSSCCKVGMAGPTSCCPCFVLVAMAEGVSQLPRLSAPAWV